MEALPTLKCPSCKSELVIQGKQRVQSLAEHVCSPNERPSEKDVYACENPQCARSSDNTRWTAMGERFGGPWTDKVFLGRNDAPFGSYQRKMNVEINRAGVPKRKELFSIGKYTFYIDYRYKSNENGEILSKKRKLLITKKDNNGSPVHWVNPFHMIIFSIKDYFSSTNKDLKTYYPPYEGRWRKVARFLLKYPLLQYNVFKQYEKEQKK